MKNAAGPTVKFDANQDLVYITVAQYEFFMAHGKEGMLAMRVYLHLLYTYRRQNLRSVWATNSYIAKGTKLGLNSVQRAKTFLKNHRMIDYRVDLDEKTKVIKGWYIFLIPDPNKTHYHENMSVDTATSIKPTTMISHTVDKSQQILLLEKENTRKEMHTEPTPPDAEKADASAPEASAGKDEMSKEEWDKALTAIAKWQEEHK